jgi:hypothetical protein
MVAIVAPFGRSSSPSTRACLDSLAFGDEQRWSSLALGSFALVRDRLHRYRRSPARWSGPSPRLLPAPVPRQGTF